MKTIILSEKDYVFCNKFNLCVLVLMINYDSEDKYIFIKIINIKINKIK